jgi:hypothetical protein
MVTETYSEDFQAKGSIVSAKIRSRMYYYSTTITVPIEARIVGTVHAVQLRTVKTVQPLVNTIEDKGYKLRRAQPTIELETISNRRAWEIPT